MEIFDYKIGYEYPRFPFLQKNIINTINPHSYCVAKRDSVFKEALILSDLLIPDGIGIVWAGKILRGLSIPRIAGADMHLHLLKEAQENKLKVFYLGSSEDTLKKIEERIHLEYPDIHYRTHSPPYKDVFDEVDNHRLRIIVNDFSPDILFVGMTAPKQEKWVHQNKEYLGASIICSIGAVFDFFAGTAKRAPVWMQKCGLEWLHRSIKSPARLGKRNLLSNPEFVWDLAKEKIKGR